MEPSTYRILRKLPDGNYFCIDEAQNLEDAQIKLMVLEAEHPGDYVACNSASGKRVQGTAWVAYVC